MTLLESVREWTATLSWREIRNGLIALLLLLLALGCALASSVAAQEGNPATAVVLAFTSLALAALVGLAVVPGLLRRVRQEWIRLPFEITREGWAFGLLLFVLALAALNTGNNLIYLILSAAMAVLVASGILSTANLKSLNLRLEFPSVVHAQQSFQAISYLENGKLWLPSCSLSMTAKLSFCPQPTTGRSPKTQPAATYFIFVPAGSSFQQKVEMRLPRRGQYRQDLTEIFSAFPFGFVRRKRSFGKAGELIVLPELESPEEFFEILPLLTGSFESYYRGQGSDLYSIRDYHESDNARFVDWKATAKTQQLKLREFTKQEDRKCCFVFDTAFPNLLEGDRACFEKAVRLCANAILHFRDMGIETRLVTRRDSTPFSRSGNGVLQNLKILALVEPILCETSGDSAWAEDSAFKILFTALPRGSIPSHIWSASHVIFVRELQP